MGFAREFEQHPSVENQQRQLDRRRDAGLILGYTYSSSVLGEDGTESPAVADPYREHVPTARPGHRAPHVWLEFHGKVTSTLDLFGRELVMLAGPEGKTWCEAASTLSAEMGAPIKAYQVGASDGDLVAPSRDWQGVYGIDEDGAVLVRPDGHVAWRSRAGSTDTEGQLRQVLRRVLGHG
jgi:hypothetical protein